MIVVADTSPLNYLSLIGYVGVLPELLGRVVVPPEVIAELSHPSTPAVVRAFIAEPQPWLGVIPVRARQDIPDDDEGERAAICLALELRAELLLIDDLDGRRAAGQRGLRVVGTIGILEAAAEHRLLDVHEACRRIKGTNFRVSDALIARLLGRVPPK